jgi:hypothetical protein
MKRFCIGFLAMILLLVVGFLISTGFQQMNNIFLWDYETAEDGDLVIKTAVASSMGFTRSCKVTQNGENLDLRFYACFGGLNSSLMAKNVFHLEIPEGVTAIRFCRPEGEYQTVLTLTDGEWTKPE